MEIKKLDEELAQQFLNEAEKPLDIDYAKFVYNAPNSDQYVLIDEGKIVILYHKLEELKTITIYEVRSINENYINAILKDAGLDAIFETYSIETDNKISEVLNKMGYKREEKQVKDEKANFTYYCYSKANSNIRKTNNYADKKTIFFVCLTIIIMAVAFMLFLHLCSYKGDYQTDSFYIWADRISSNSSIYDKYRIINNYSKFKELTKNEENLNLYDENFFKDNNLALVGFTEFDRYKPDLVSVKKRRNIVNITINADYHSFRDDPYSIYLIPVPKSITEINVKYFDIRLLTIVDIIIAFILPIIIYLVVKYFYKGKDNEQDAKKFLKIFKRVIISYVVIALLLFILCLPSLRPSIDKPIIYLYPTEEMEISVRLGYPDKITTSYPNYQGSWDVLAKPDGDLVDLDDGRNLYSLYYESEAVTNFKVEEDGFIVKREEVLTFLEEKLAILGLTEKEAEEFIIYWLPRLQEHEYNYIRFASLDEINANMPLEFSVKPDSLIRVLMTYKGLNKPIEVQEQTLKEPERKGFVAVEWGGTEIK